MDRNKFIHKFKNETDAQLLLLSQRLVDLERLPGSADLINEIFRVAHTLKGNAKMLNLEGISKVAHEMETFFAELRDGKITLLPEMTDILFEAIDVLQQCNENVLKADAPDIETAPVILQLKHLVSGNAPAAPATPELAPPPEKSATPGLSDRFLHEALGQLLLVSQQLIELEKKPDEGEAIREIFRAVHSLKGNAAMLGYTSVKEVANEVEEVLMAVHDRGVKLDAAMMDVLFEALEALENEVRRPPSGDTNRELVAKIKALLAPPEEESPPATPPPAEPAKPVPAQSQPAQSGASRAFSATLSVDVGKLDDLMNITGELVLAKMEADSTLSNLNHLLDLMRNRARIYSPVRNVLGSNDPFDHISMTEFRDALLAVNQMDQQIETLLRSAFREYEEHTNHLQNTVDELESNVLSIRMLPIGTLFEEFRPFVRNTARALGRKNPELIQTGNEIELDKKVLEGIRDPLVHLIRNGLDHGIELPEARLAAGKPEAGRITMAASQEGGYVYIRVSDDGAGMNLNRLRDRAVEKGFMTEVKARNALEVELLNLIYEPGFSTSRIITDNSGRGVGMDVVKKNIERLGGQVSTRSAPGQGTTFTLKVPLTIATSRALLVKVGAQIYAIPAPNIEAMLYLTPNEILTRSGRDVVLHRGNLIPLVRLADLLGQNRNADHPLYRWQVQNNERQGLSLAGIGLSMRLTNQEADNEFRYNNGNGKTNSQSQTLDMFDGLTLATPEAATHIQELQTGERKRSRFAFERMPGVIVGSGDRRFCLLVDSLEDEIEVVVKSLSSLLKVPHVSSATILGDGRVVMILDVPNLVSSAREAIVRSGIKQKGTDQSRKKRILVVDDSITTRELEKSILEAAGFTVDTADDGTVALEILNRNNIYDLVISDVEMPRMDGFELTSRIKTNAALKQLPVIIVSSLNSEENKRRGINAGAQAYITKGDFNQNNLLDTIEYLTS